MSAFKQTHNTMGNKIICRKKSDKNQRQSDGPKVFSRNQTVAAEEIMKKSAWFIDKEEIDNYFSKEELLFYRRNHQYSKKISEMMIIPSKPAEIRFLKKVFCNFDAYIERKKFQMERRGSNRSRCLWRSYNGI